MSKKFRRSDVPRIIGRSRRPSCIETLEHRLHFHGFIDDGHDVSLSALPTLIITKQATNPSENGAIRAFTITRDGSLAAPLTVNFLIGGRARNGVDYGRIGSAATIAAGESFIRIKVRPVDDALVEGTETVTLTLQSNATYQLTDSTSSTMRIIDNDVPGDLPTVSVSGPVGSASESGRTRAFTITRSGSLAADLPVSFIMGGKATNGVDYGKFGTSAVIPAGQASIQLRVRPVDDTKIELTESVTLNLQPGGYAVSPTASAATIRIFDNDTPSVSIGFSAASTPENSSVTVDLDRTGVTSEPLVVHLEISGSASSADYSSIPGTVTISTGSTSTSFSVTPIDDSLVEGDETIVITISPDPAYVIGSSGGRVTIIDNDTAFGTNISWATVAASPVPRGEAEHAVVNNKLYVFGGYTDFTATNSTRCDVYDPATNTWTQIANMPVGVTHAGTAVVGHDVYIAGGYTGGPGGSQIFATTQVQVYNTDTNTWSAAAALPQARGGGAMAAVLLTDLTNELHFFGGSDSSRNDRGEHWSLDLNTGGATWQSRPALPTSRTHMGAVTINDKIYAVGGQKNQDAAEQPQSAVEMFDPATNAWTAKAPLPFGRSHIASSTIVVQGRIVTLGGETTYQNSVNNVSAYNPATNTWQELTGLPTARASGVGAFINGAYYFTTGGVTSTTWKGTILS